MQIETYPFLSQNFTSFTYKAFQTISSPPQQSNNKTFRAMKFSDLQRGDLFCFPNGEDSYKKIGDRLAMPMCSRMNHVADVRPETEVIGMEQSAYSRDREENMPDFEELTWELQCQIAEMGE